MAYSRAIVQRAEARLQSEKEQNERSSRARIAAKLPSAEVERFGPEAAHELLREADPVRDRALAAIDQFLETHAR